MVDLNGVVFDEKEREAQGARPEILRVAAENPPGVRAVENYLVRVEPISGTICATGAQRATKP